MHCDPSPAGQWFLALVLAADILVNAMLSPYFFDPVTLSDATFNFTEKAIVALPMALLIVIREIDISVAAIIALASVAMGLGAAQGARTSRLLSLSASARASWPGRVNGTLVTILRVPSIVATIGTMSLFRGIAYGVLGDRVLRDYPADFAWFGQGYAFGLVSVELVMFALLAAVTAYVLHFTVAGRHLYAIGANFDRSPLLRHPGRSLPLLAVRRDRSGERPCRRIADFATWSPPDLRSHKAGNSRSSASCTPGRCRDHGRQGIHCPRRNPSRVIRN